MTGDQFGGIVRTIAVGVLTWLAAKGILIPEQVADLAAALSVIAVAVWSYWTNRPAKIAPKE